jgi:hypothetical protein
MWMHMLAASTTPLPTAGVCGYLAAGNGGVTGW